MTTEYDKPTENNEPVENQEHDPSAAFQGEGTIPETSKIAHDEPSRSTESTKTHDFVGDNSDANCKDCKKPFMSPEHGFSAKSDEPVQEPHASFPSTRAPQSDNQ